MGVWLPSTKVINRVPSLRSHADSSDEVMEEILIGEQSLTVGLSPYVKINPGSKKELARKSLASGERKICVERIRSCRISPIVNFGFVCKYVKPVGSLAFVLL